MIMIKVRLSTFVETKPENNMLLFIHWLNDIMPAFFLEKSGNVKSIDNCTCKTSLDHDCI